MTTAILPDDTALDTNDFPARLAAPLPLVDVPPPSRGVRLDLAEEAELFGLSPEDDGVRYGIEADPFMHRSPEEIDADWEAWDRYQAAMSRWIDGRGPHPDTV